MSHSGSGQSVSEDSTESQSGSTTTTNTKPKLDFGKKHRKVVRILTVVAYIISVSTAAVLLSAYYVFLWKPSPPDKKPTSDTPSTLALARQLTQNFQDDDDYHGSSSSSRYNSLDLFPPSPSFNDNHLLLNEEEDEFPQQLQQLGQQSQQQGTHDVNPKFFNIIPPNDSPQIPVTTSIPHSLIIQNILTSSPPSLLPTVPLSSSSSSSSPPSLLLLSPSNIPPTTRRVPTESLVLTNLTPSSSSSSFSTTTTNNLNPTQPHGQEPIHPKNL